MKRGLYSPPRCRSRQARGELTAMRRLALLLALLLPSQMLTGSASAQAGLTSTGITRYRVESVAGDWIIPRKIGRKFDWIVVQVVRRTDLDTNKVRLFASAGVGDCSTRQDGAFTCSAELRSRRVVSFEADPEFRTVEVVLRSGENRHDIITWKFEHPYGVVPPVVAHPEPCPDDKVGTIAEIYVVNQRAAAEGRVFGRSVSTAAEPNDLRAPEDMTQRIETKDCP